MLTPGVPVMDRLAASLEEHLKQRQALELRPQGGPAQGFPTNPVLQILRQKNSDVLWEMKSRQNGCDKGNAACIVKCCVACPCWPLFQDMVVHIIGFVGPGFAAG